MPINNEHLASLTDADVVDERGDKVGGVGQIYLDDATGQPAWVSVKSGLFGMRESFVPLAAADVVDGDIQVPYSKNFIKDAPRVDADNHLDDGQQATLHSYYGVERSAGAGQVGADPTASFGSEQTADDLASGQTASEPVAPAEDSSAGGPEFTEQQPASHDDEQQPASHDDEQQPASHDDEQQSVKRNDPDPEMRTTYQQDNPQARPEWEASSPGDPKPTTAWNLPATDPATEEPTEVSRSGYSPDRPAAHSSAYEGHGDPVSGAGALAADETAAAPGGTDPVAGAPGDPLAPSADDDGIGTVEPVTSEGPDAGSAAGEHAEFERVGDDAATAEAEGRPTEGDPQGPDAMDTGSVPYEVPGAERGSPIGTGAGLASVSGAGAGAEKAFADDAEGGDVALEPDAAADQGQDPEEFGPEGYRPDRDGQEMTDEERQRLNEARGAL